MEHDGLRWNAMTVATELSFKTKNQSETSLSMHLKKTSLSITA
jgi:hypothetical protein